MYYRVAIICVTAVIFAGLAGMFLEDHFGGDRSIFLAVWLGLLSVGCFILAGARLVARVIEEKK
jgi:hypothetical protein